MLVKADALDRKKLGGSVASVSAMMGRKSISTGDPADKSDRDTLEAVIDLEDSSRPLPIGLRVTVQFGSSSSQCFASTSRITSLAPDPYTVVSAQRFMGAAHDLKGFEHRQSRRTLRLA